MTQDSQQEICSITHISCNSRPYRQIGGLSYSAGRMTSAERIGAWIKEWRLKREMSQEVLGEKAGTDGPRIGRLEKGTENPTVETLDKLTAALEIDLSHLTAPRPEEGADDEQAEVGTDRNRARVARYLRSLVDAVDVEFPAQDNWQGDVHKAIAALNRALRREADSGAPPEATPKAR